MKLRTILLTFLTVLVIGLGTGCPSDDGVGDKLEDAAEDAGDAVGDAAEDAGDAIDDAADEIDDAVDDNAPTS